MVRRSSLVLVVLGAWACGGSAQPPHPQHTAASEATKLAAVAPPVVESAPSNAPCDTRRIRTCYGRLRTVGGRGQRRDKGHNGWRAKFEGTSATKAELSRPHFAMADDAGNIYIADKDAHAIRKINLAGDITTVAGTGTSGDDGDGPASAVKARLASPNGLWVRGDGTLYVLDLGNGKIRSVSVDGRMTTLFSAPMRTGRGLWVSDDETHAFVASGNHVIEWKRGQKARVFSRGYRDLGNLAVDPNGHLVLTDRGAGRVYRLDKRGKRSVIAGSGKSTGGGAGSPALESALEGVRAVWFDARGGYFLGTHESSRVWYVDRDGLLQGFLGSDEVSEVRGLSINSAGRLIIVDNDRGFVRTL